MPVWKRLIRSADYKAIDFTIVYILEAHAEDEWPISSCCDNPIGEIVRINQHKSQEDRMNAAKDFAKTFSFRRHDRILVDDMENCFNEQFGAWPFRYYVLDGKEVRLIGMPESSGNGDKFSEQPLLDYLERFVPLDFTMEEDMITGPFIGSAKMLHYCSGRKGYNEIMN